MAVLNTRHSDMSDSGPIIEQFERLIRRDPALRGLVGSEAEFGPLCRGHLAAAAEDLAGRARHVVLVTGFFIPHADPPAAETDGPPGAMLLARVLQALGADVTVVTDEFCLSAVRCAAEAYGVPESCVTVFRGDENNRLEEFFQSGPGATLSHLISIERGGPSHTRESILGQHRGSGRETAGRGQGSGVGSQESGDRASSVDSTDHGRRTTDNGPSFADHPASDAEHILAEFESEVPPSSRGRCHNMRGEVIGEYTAGMHRLFEELHRFRPQAKTVGIGDGGNEIGMGSISWEELRRRIPGRHAGRISGRIAADWTIVAGVSNWGAQALAAAMAVLRGRVEVLREFDLRREEQAIEHLVEHGPAVDGLTARREPTVDSLPFITYIQPWLGIRRLLGFED